MLHSLQLAQTLLSDQTTHFDHSVNLAHNAWKRPVGSMQKFESMQEFDSKLRRIQEFESKWGYVPMASALTLAH